MNKTSGEELTEALRSLAQAYAPGAQVAPCAVLWPDPEREWLGVLPQLQKLMPELYVLESYAPEERRGPALWLRCIEARVVEGAPPAGTVPIFYLPGMSRDTLRNAEDCTQEVAALVELQYRGTLWMHLNGREWTPYAFLVSKNGGLELDVAKDQATKDALAGALPALLELPVSQLRNRRLDAEYFNGLLAPDATGLLLRWLAEPEAFQKSRTAAQWNAFCQLCKTEYRFDPVKDGPLKGTRLLAGRDALWEKVWARFAEAPASHPGLPACLRRAAPAEATVFESAEIWPDVNEREEGNLLRALETLADRPQGKAALGLAELELQHGVRREYPWQKLGLSPLATALAPLARLAHLCQSSHGAPTAEAYADYYALTGWQVDAAALATMAACGAQEHHGPLLGALRAVYLPWLEATSRHLQNLVQQKPSAVGKRHAPLQPAPGRVILFSDGLRMDVARLLADKLAEAGLECAADWEWSTIPSVTASAKPAASPVSTEVQGAAAGDPFSTRSRTGNQPMNQDRFLAALKTAGWQCLKADETGDPAGSAWAEAGTLDKRGHNEGWKLARSVGTEVDDLNGRITRLLKAGWKEVLVVTDHGWLLLPGGLPKVELKASLADHRWGRCAALKEGADPGVPVLPWHWNNSVFIATPPGAGCYRASMEYTHGGVSLQEMVTPLLKVTSGGTTAGPARLSNHKWSNANCRVSTRGEVSGMSIDVRTTQTDADSSLLAGGQPKKIGANGAVTVYLENDADAGRKAEIVLLDSTGKVVDFLPTTLGE